MAKDEVKKEAPKSRFKVVGYGEYLVKARELLAKGPVDGMTEVYDIAISLLYSEHEVIATVQKSGETRFVCKV